MEHTQLDLNEWSQLLLRLGGEEALALSARKHGAFIRARGVKSAADLLRLALLYGPGGHSLRSVAALAAVAGLADVSDVAVLDRLKGAADWLEGLCRERIARVAKEIGIDAIKRPIRIVDGSRLEGPGDRVWRLHLCYDPALILAPMGSSPRVMREDVVSTDHSRRSLTPDRWLVTAVNTPRGRRCRSDWRSPS